jgi:hypothetical protein
VCCLQAFLSPLYKLILRNWILYFFCIQSKYMFPKICCSASQAMTLKTTSLWNVENYLIVVQYCPNSFVAVNSQRYYTWTSILLCLIVVIMPCCRADCNFNAIRIYSQSYMHFVQY